MPGVESASLAQMIMVGPSRSETFISIESHDAALKTDEIAVEFNVVAPQYLQTMKIPLLRGRDFSEADRAGAPGVAIIDETMARRHFAGEDAIGKHFTNGKALFEIIGVAESGKQRVLGREPNPFVYFAFAQTEKQFFNSQMTLLVRSAMSSEGVFSRIRSEVSALDKNMPLQTTMPFTEYIRLSILPQRIVAAIAGVFGVTGLLLAAIGIYGVMSYSVAQRTYEIGVRRALGAQTRDVLGMVLGQGLRITLIGVSLGLAGAFAVTRLLSSLLYGVSATDPFTFIVIPLILTGVALGASFVPARRATKVDPMVALRHE
jgi:predicted permease